jgi:hypothetical protein
MSLIFYSAKLQLSKYDSSLVVSIKQSMNFNIQLPSTFMFLVFHKMGLI